MNYVHGNYGEVKLTKKRNNPLAIHISKCHTQKYYSVLTYHVILIKNSICLSYKLLKILKQISFSILNWYEPEKRKKKSEKLCCRKNKTKLSGGSSVHSLNLRAEFPPPPRPKKGEIWVFSHHLFKKITPIS